MIRILVLMLLVALSGRATDARAATLLGPTAYLSAADSPFPLGTGSFCLETFEDGLLDVPGVTGNGSVIGPSGITDSVDADDGSIDGSGTGGSSYFSGDGPGGITFTFDPGAPLGLPTSAGVVWTDGGLGVSVTFEAFDQNGVSLGTVGPVAIADNSNAGETAEDRFFGVTNAGGISAIKVSNPGGGIEVDHLQYDHCGGSATSTTSTSSPPTTTTTTIPSGACDGVPIGATFASIDCRIAALRGGVAGESRLGLLQPKLLKSLDGAKTQNAGAEATCAGGDAKHARKQLQRAAKALQQFAHRLRSNAVRKKVPGEVRDPFATASDAIQTDVKALRRSLACPAG